MMTRDLRRDRKDLYAPGTGEFVEVLVPPITYLAIDGRGDPNTSAAYSAAVQSLYAAAHGVRNVVKSDPDQRFVVGPIEGLWASPDPGAFAAGRKDDWDWTMMLPLPGPPGRSGIEQGLADAARKKPALPIAELRVLELDEGRCLQMLHLGSFDQEAATLRRLHEEVMPARGLTFNGRHHEIYLSDPRRVEPDRMRTVLRQPVRPLAGH